MMVAYLAEEALCENADGLHDWIHLSDPATAEDGSTVQTGFSLAEAWISEPEWNGESSEAASEIGEGSREPECTARESCPR